MSNNKREMRLHLLRLVLFGRLRNLEKKKCTRIDVKS